MSGRGPLLYLVIALLGLAVLEGLSFVAARILLSTGLLVAPADLSGYDEYLGIRDPVVGWPSPTVFGTGEYDISGSRVVPAFPDPGQDSCVALFGDSFTWGDEVGPADAYGNVLAERMGCRVANYGVGGYGTDQAALRYMQVVADDAPVIVMGHFSDNITRNVNRLRDFIGSGRFGFKPRFIVADDELRLLPLPDLTAEQYARVTTDADELLPHEFFAPDTWGGPGAMRFPYTRAVAYAAAHYRVSAALRGIRPTYKPFYDAGHASGALEVTARLLSRAAAEAANRGQRFFVLLIPDLHDLRAVRSGEKAAYAPLREQLEETGMDVIDAAEYFDAAFSGQDFCDLFVSCGASHFNPVGYRMLAEAVYRGVDARPVSD